MTAQATTSALSRLRALLLATAFAVTAFGIKASPVDVSRPGELAPETARAYACADGPSFEGWLTNSTSSHPNVTTSSTGDVYAWISNVVDDWSCTAFYRYDGVMWALSATKGNFAWGNLINSTSVSCNWAIGSNDYVKANSTNDCPDSDAEYAYLIHLGDTAANTLFEGTLNDDSTPDARGDSSFIHSDCESYYGASPERWNQSFGTGTGPRPGGGSNCDPYSVDAFNNNVSLTVDATAPTASYSTTPTTPTNATSLAYGLTFSESVTGLASSDFTVGGTATGWTVGAITGSGAGPYTFSLTGGTSGTVTLALAANGVTDAVGNTGPAAATAAPTVTVDRTAPTASYSTTPTTPTNATSLTYTVTFSEAVTGLTASDLTRTGSATGWSVSVGSPTGNAYPITATGGTSGTLTLTLAAGAVADAVGNAGPATAISAPVVTIDRTAPTASFSTTPTTPTNATSLAYGVTFSEPVTGLAGSDFTIGGSATGWMLGAVSGSGAGPYTFSLTGGTAGTVTLALAANSVTDGVNTGPTTATSAPVVTVDRTAPSGTVSINSSAPYTTSATLTLTASATDAGSPPVSQMRFSNDGSTWTTYAYTTSKPWTLASGADGSRVVYAQFLDAAGNWNAGTAISDTIVLDTTDPSAAIAISGGAAATSSPSVVLSVTATDATSGVALTQASNDNVTFIAVSGTTPGWTLTSGDGIKTVWYRVTDAAGRVATVSDTISLITEWVPGSASSIVVPYQATGWKFQQVVQGGSTGFEASTFDDTAWPTGTGAFASGGGCAVQNDASTHTAWSTNTDMLVRRHITLSPGTTGVQVWVSIDNDISAIYWNGVQIGGPSTHENCPTLDNRAFSVSPGLVTADNVLAIRARDRGIEAYFDARVLTGGMPIEPALDGTISLENGATAGDPVQTYSGAFTYSHTDLAIAGRGPSPVFTRSYNSADTRVGPLGPGWTDSYYMRLREPGDGSGDILFVRADGNTDRFTRNNNETFSPSPATYATLIRNADLTYTVTELNGDRFAFDAGGKLTAIIDRYGNTAALGYDGSGRLASVADPASRGSLTLAYTGNRLATVTDWMTPARTVTYGYDAQGRLQTATDREGKTTSYGYDGLTSRITTITDARGHFALTLTYDSQGRVATQKDAQGLITGATTTFGYVVNGDGTRVTTTTTPPTLFESSFSPTTVDTFTAQGWITQRVTRPSSAETLTEAYTYDVVGNRSSVTDARGNRTDYCYDVSYTGGAISGSRGNLTRTIGPAPSAGAARPVTLLKYDGKNNQIQQVSPKGVPSTSATTCTTDLSAISAPYVTDYAFDGTGTLLLSMTQRFTDPDLGLQAAVTKYEYGDAANAGLVTRLIPPRGNTGSSPDYSYASTIAYFGTGSRAGLPQLRSDALGSTITYDYDAAGRMTSSVDQLGNAAGGVPADHRTEYVYDKEDRTRFVKLPAPTSGGAQLVSETRYDEVGNPVVRINAAGQVTTYAYDDRDALLQVKESPNAWGDPAAPPAGVITTEYTYDAAGMMTRVTRAKGDAANERVTDYAYDGRNLVRWEKQYPAWPSTTGALVTSSTYDAAGNLATTTDPLGRATTYAYDPLNRRTSIDYSDAGTPDVGYAYDANGNRSSMTDGTGTTTYAPDELGRRTSVTTPGPTVVGYRYDLDGHRSKLVYPDATAVAYAYDKAGRMSGLTDWASRTVGYTYFPDGALQTATNPDGTVAAYAYDNARRTNGISDTRGTTTLDSYAYTLDAAGNVTGLTEGAGTFAYTLDRMSRLTGVTGPDGPRAYAYDPAGNRTSATAGTTTGYTYDRADRMIAAGAEAVTVSAAGAVTARGSDTFAYDQANRLTSATVGGTTETYVYDGDGVRFSRRVGTGPVIRFTSDMSRSLPVTIADGTRTYVWGLGLAYSVAGTALEVYHADRLGSVRMVTDGTGTVTDSTRFDEWGIPVAATGSSTQPYGFTGEPRDASGLTYLRARYYDPALGRFATRDTWSGRQALSQSQNRYAYVDGNPGTSTDPSGRCIEAMALAIAGPGGAVAGGGITVACVIVVGAVAVVGGALVGAGIGQATAPLVTGGPSQSVLDQRKGDTIPPKSTWRSPEQPLPGPPPVPMAPQPDPNLDDPHQIPPNPVRGAGPAAGIIGLIVAIVGGAVSGQDENGDPSVPVTKPQVLRQAPAQYGVPR